MTRPLPLLALVGLLLSGCATVTSFPRPFGGLQGHLYLMGATREDPGHWKNPPRGSACVPPYLAGFTSWRCARPFYWPLCPLALADLALSVPLDLVLAPVTLTLDRSDLRPRTRGGKDPRLSDMYRRTLRRR